MAFLRVQQRELDRFPQEMRPALLGLREPSAIHGRIVTDRDAREHVRRQQLVERRVILAAAELQDRVQRRLQRPQRAAFRVDLPTRLVEVDHRRQGDQLAQGVEVRLPVPSQLIQQRVGLRLLDRQPTEELQQRAGLVERHPHDVHQVGHEHHDLQTVLAARQQAGHGRSVAAMFAPMHAIRDTHRSPVDDPPRHTRPSQHALAGFGLRGKHVLESRRLRQLVLGRQPPAPRRLLFLPPSAPPLFIRRDAVIRGSSRPTHILRRRRLIPRQTRFEHLHSRRQPPIHFDLLKQQLQHLLDRDRPRRHALLQTRHVHAEELNHPPILEYPSSGNGQLRSNRCISLQNCVYVFGP